MQVAKAASKGRRCAGSTQVCTLHLGMQTFVLIQPEKTYSVLILVLCNSKVPPSPTEESEPFF